MNNDKKYVSITILVDASNVAFFTYSFESGKKIGKIENIEKIFKAMEEITDDNKDINIVIYYICDSTLKHRIDHSIKLEEYISNNIILQTPAGAKTDDFILAYLKKNSENTFVISNDLFRQFPKDLLKYISQWRLPFMIINDFILDSRFEIKLNKVRKQLEIVKNYKQLDKINTIEV